MKIEEHILYWVESAEHDFETAESLFASGKYDWGLFIGHLVLEKILKALYVRDNQNQLPPKIHNLIKPAEHTDIELDTEMKIFLDEVNDFNLEVRYPEYRHEFYKNCTKDFAESYFFIRNTHTSQDTAVVLRFAISFHISKKAFPLH
ncbi:MAG: HEPN domain-containing protein, partial [Desulfobacterales bacterium]|nr:HEPN domain-containing protein [Desulfobacterales bacterium]